MINTPFSVSDNNCAVCLTDLNSSKTKQLTCNHVFHENCINPWLVDKDTCPLCREVVKKTLPTTPIINININIPAAPLNIPVRRTTQQRNSNRNLVLIQELINKLKRTLIIILFILSILYLIIYVIL